MCLFGLHYITPGVCMPVLTPSCVSCSFPYLSNNLDFLCGWLPEGDSWREAAAPQRSTARPCCFPRIEGSAGYGQSRERSCRVQSMSSHRRKAAGARRLIASQSVTGLGFSACLPEVKRHPKLLTGPLFSSCIVKLTEIWGENKKKLWKRPIWYWEIIPAHFIIA